MMDKLKTESIILTPEMASKWLQKNVSNRPLSNYRVAELAEAIKCGEWELNHQGMALNKKGEMTDGQHRCYAVIRTGIPIETQISYYADDRTALNHPIDEHRPRSVSNILGISSTTTATYNFLFCKVLYNLVARKKCRREIKILMDKYPELTSWIDNNVPLNKKLIVGTAPIRAAIVLGHMLGYEWQDEYKVFASAKFEEMGQYPNLPILFRRLMPYSKMTTTDVYGRIAFGATFAIITHPGKVYYKYTDSFLDESWNNARLSFKNLYS
jgi:hypothetical protein